ncbi:MAG: flippase-like domain-containing protein [Clostridiales bacterium]|jgi:uncharacterized protein (TIRG00374 family)|nr:flippase-like domain-containing protein [Clostridiales bacterium]
MKDKLIPLIIGKGPEKKWTLNKASRVALFIVSFFVAGYALFVSLSSGGRVVGLSGFLSAVTANGGWFLIAVLLFLTVILAETARFVILIYATKKTFRPVLAFRTFMIGRFYSAVTPFANGGQGLQARILTDAKLGKAVSFSVPFSQVFLKTLTWNILLLIFFIFNSQEIQGLKWWALAGLVFNGIFPLLFFIFSVNEKAAKRIIAAVLKLGTRVKIVKNYDAFLGGAWSFLEDLSISVKSIVRNLRPFLALLLLYGVEFMAVMSIPYFLFKGAGADVSYNFMLISYMYIYLSTTFLPIPGGAGAYELLFLTMYSALAGDGMAYWLMFTMRFFTYFFYIIGGYIVQLVDSALKYARKRREIRRLIAEHTEKENRKNEAARTAEGCEESGGKTDEKTMKKVIKNNGTGIGKDTKNGKKTT